MKNVAIWVLFNFLSFTLASQDYEYLDANNIKAGFYKEGDLFRIDDSLSISQFEVPAGSGWSTIDAGNLWIGGIDDSGGLRLAAQTYRQSGDFWPGPVADNYSTHDLIYNRIWKVSKTEIENHIANFNAIGYIVPESINEWPGNGNTSNGEAHILAPYVDVNSNGIYDPANGDYPVISGDQAVYFIINDERGIHAESGGPKMSIEIHGIAYAFNMPSNEVIHNTIFVNYTIFNRSNQNYKDVYVGLWVDFDWTCFMGQYAGCDTLLNTFFAYNDGSTSLSCFPNPRYESNPPAQGAVTLNNPLSSFMAYNNSFSQLGNPVTHYDFYNYLTARWADGSHLTFGGNGYGGSIKTNYAYSGNIDLFDTTSWSMLNANIFPYDTRSVGSIGPFNLNAGQKICLDYAFPFAWDTMGSYLGSVALLKQRVQQVQAFYNSELIGCNRPLVGIFDGKQSHYEVLVYPNPAIEYLYIASSNSQGRI